MVKEFAQEAVTGLRCECAVGRTIEGSGMNPPPMRPALIFLDRVLESVRLTMEDEENAGELALPMVALLDVVRSSAETEFFGGCHESRELRFVCLRFDGSIEAFDALFAPLGPGRQEQYKDRVVEVGLLMPTPYERERFFTSMKILRLAAEGA